MLFDGNTSYYSNFQENESNETKEGKEIDYEREAVVKRIKMESNFYNVFRNTLRIVLNSGIDKSIRAELLNIVNDPKIGYYQKLDILKDKLTEILSECFVPNCGISITSSH